MEIKYFDVTIEWNEFDYVMTYPARSKEAARKKAFDEFNETLTITDANFSDISSIELRMSPPDIKYKYVAHQYEIAPVVGQEFSYYAMGEEFHATVVAPTHEDVASVFFIIDGQDEVMRIHPHSFRKAVQSSSEVMS
jgi:hypothetical protein